MSEKPKTRGVFAAFISDMHLRPRGFQLLSERMDDQGWNMLGGGVEAGESDEEALKRECREEAGLEIKILHMLGEALTFGHDTSVCYLCLITGGVMRPSAEAKCHRWCSADEVRQGFWVKTHHGDPAAQIPPSTTNERLHIVGPTNRLSPTGRRVWDVFTIMGQPEFVDNPNTIYPGIEVSEDKGSLIDVSCSPLKVWRRLDPYTASGFMVPVPPTSI